MSVDAVKQELLAKLKQEHCFWSYNESSVNEVSDEILIDLIPQEEYLYTLNRFFAWYYFKVKKPDAYIKSMATRHLNKMLA